MGATGDACRICGALTEPVAEVRGRLDGRTFHLRRCPACGFACVADPRTDFDAIYTSDYYAGRGVDPLVDYEYELAHPERTIRRYEWRGILTAVGALAGVGPGTRWLDYGCGTGGLVLHLRERGLDAVGHEQGWSLPRLLERGVPVLGEEELAGHAGGFDVVTAIEVIEHVVDPVSELRRMAALLRPGGVLFLTTGNAAPHREHLERWAYVIPEIHVSFFEPRTLALALERAGLRPEFPGFGPGWTDIIRFKALKNLRRRSITPVDRLLPWRPVAEVLDRRLGLSRHPVGRA